MSSGGAVRRTKEEAQATRNRILDAAERIFHAKGVAGASLEDIAAGAKVTRGAIYWHFRDKGELFNAMMKRVELPAQALMDRVERAGATDRLDVLRRSACEVLVRTARERRLRRIAEIANFKCEYVGDAAAIRARHVADHRQCLAAIEAGFRECVREGLLPAGVDPREAALGAMAYVSGLIAQWVLDPESFSLERHAKSLVDIYFRGLEGKPAAPRRAGPRKDGRPTARK
jgi:TetR/AcrR family acrAB operon transcriptional repressor